MASPPHAVVIAGPNGAGKSTIAPDLLRDYLEITAFVNADVIAQGLSGFDPDSAALEAGRIIWKRLKEMSSKREDFAFETTLASRTFARWLDRIKSEFEYRVFVLFLWLPSPEHAVARVNNRVQQGGHDVPEEVIRRRYYRGIRNFLDLYQPLADSWIVFDNSSPLKTPNIVAMKAIDARIEIRDQTIWKTIQDVSSV